MGTHRTALGHLWLFKGNVILSIEVPIEYKSRICALYINPPPGFHSHIS